MASLSAGIEYCPPWIENGGQHRLPAFGLPASSGGSEQAFTIVIPVFTIGNNCVHDE
jgi:hypothetical protein